MTGNRLAIRPGQVPCPKIAAAVLATVLVLGVQSSADASDDDWISRSIEGGMALDGLALTGLGLLAVRAAAAVNGPDYRERLAALSAGLSRHPVLGKAFVVAALGKFGGNSPSDMAAVRKVVCDLGWDASSCVAMAGNTSARRRSYYRPGPPAAGQARLTPPGDCGPDQYTDLKQSVEASCERQEAPASCRDVSGRDADFFLLQMARFGACIQARSKLNETCFRGGDNGHRTAVNDLRNGLARCKEALDALDSP